MALRIRLSSTCCSWTRSPWTCGKLSANCVRTKTLLFAGQGCGLFRSGAGGSTTFYAYDKQTGAVVHEMELPGGTCGVPMTYSWQGKQYIIVPIGYAGHPGEFVALTVG